ncbi:MAG TPA: lasso peptide biosynthesis B2 protein [Sphingomicrobium sp.]|jgi:hypothetical protein|nr:lasso peptide biosynthesis B2 protein [Sphingomicrobium sp.]
MARRAGALRRLRRNTAQFARLDKRAAFDLLRAVYELALARVELLAADPEAWLAERRRRRSPGEAASIDRVAFAIPRAAARVPWRATCLVQALAAQRWLARMGVSSRLKLGARKTSEQAIDAHAWLEAGGRIVVGGDPQGYQPFTPPRRPRSG